MSKKNKTTFFCQSCGYESAKWLGKCVACLEWNTFVEEKYSKADNSDHWIVKKQADSIPKKLSEIKWEEKDRIITSDDEFNRVLGGGLVKGSLTIISGEPGIGKSTLLLQIALSLNKLKVLYISGEESSTQIKMRADRIGYSSDNCFIFTETNLKNIFLGIDDVDPEVIIIDSIQTLHSDSIDSTPGSVSQIRECTAAFIRLAKESGIPVLIIGHITKDGTIAGPKLLEHMVDTVLLFEGDNQMNYRLIRTTKNRFGSTDEIGIYEMSTHGLLGIKDPSDILLSNRDQDISGIAIGGTIEGNRPLLIEVQSLVSTATYGTPQRSTTGFDIKRLHMLLAVLEKRVGYRLATNDIFLNITGGLKVADPSIDLSVCVSVVSSFLNQPLSKDSVFFAEVGLGGELRSVNRLENRLNEAHKLGLKQVYVAKMNTKGLKTKYDDMEIIAFSKIEELMRHLF